jgi:hypothetical protein
VYARIHEQQLKRDAEELKRRFQQLGDDSGDSFSKGVIKAHRDVERSNERLAKSLNTIKAANDRISASTESVNIAHRARVATQEQLKRATEDAEKAQAEYDAVLASGTNDVKKLNAAEQERNAALRDQKRLTDQMITANLRLGAAHRNKAAADRAELQTIRDYNTATRSVIQANRDVDRSFLDMARGATDLDRKGKGLTGTLTALGSTAFGVTRGLGSIAAVAALPLLISGLDDLIGIAVTASQSILTLPAALTAAAAGFGTLKLATAGFSDTIKEIGDPKKFAEAIQGLSPAAQQAALSIQALMPQFTVLKNATQDSFFAGFGGIGGKIENLMNTYLPEVQQLTTGIAGSLNKMMSGVFDTLMSAGGQSDMAATMQNIAQAFENAAPAAQSFTDAILDLVAQGSELLPGLGTDVAELAENFANWVSDARESGDLRTWMEDGINAVKEIADAFGRIGGVIYDVFAKDGKRNIENFKTDIETLANTIHGLATSIRTITDAWNNITGQAEDSPWNPNSADAKKEREKYARERGWLQPADPSRPEYEPPTGQDQRDRRVGTGPTGQDQRDRRGAGPYMPPAPSGPAPAPGDRPVPPRPPKNAGRGPSERDQLDAIIAGLNPSEYHVDPYGGMGGGGGGMTGGGPPDENSIREWVRANFGIPNSFGTGAWENAVHPKDGLLHDTGQAFDFAGSPEQMANLANWVAQNALGQTKELIYQGPGFDPSSLINNGQFNPSAYSDSTLAGHTDHVHWAPDGMPGGRVDGKPGQGVYGSGRRGLVDPQKVLEADHDVQKAAHELEEARKERIALEQSNFASQEQISDAKWKEQEKEWALQAKQDDLIKARMGTLDKTKSSMEKFGASIDSDFGISKGLAGIAENLTKFIANLAMAPVLGMLGGVSQANGGAKGGVGLLGAYGAAGGFGGASYGFGPMAVNQGGTTGSTGGIYPSAGSPSMPTPNALGLPSGPSPAPNSTAGVWSSRGQMPTSGGGEGLPLPSGMVPNPASTTYGGVEPYSNPQGGHFNIPGSDLISGAVGAAGPALDAMAPGAGTAAAIAAETAIKLANRAIEYGGQIAGSAAGGLVETFLPFGASELANNNWLTRLVGGIAGAAPAIPNLTGGGAGGQNQQGPLGPQQVRGNPQGLGGQLSKAPINVNYTNVGATEDRAGADIAHHLRVGYQGAAV